MRTLTSFLLATSIVVFSCKSPDSKQQPQPEVYTTGEGAVGGYDVVAYFTNNQPVKGDSAITAEWNGAVWHFASEENKNAFVASPEKYVPQYGGYCAFGMSRGYKAPTLPEAWTIVDNKLFLNYNLEVRDTWKTDTNGYIEKADKNWPEAKSK